MIGVKVKQLMSLLVFSIIVVCYFFSMLHSDILNSSSLQGRGGGKDKEVAKYYLFETYPLNLIQNLNAQVLGQGKLVPCLKSSV